jgi:hypothetical protein
MGTEGVPKFLLHNQLCSLLSSLSWSLPTTGSSSPGPSPASAMLGSTAIFPACAKPAAAARWRRRPPSQARALPVPSPAVALPVPTQVVALPAPSQVAAHPATASWLAACWLRQARPRISAAPPSAHPCHGAKPQRCPPASQLSLRCVRLPRHPCPPSQPAELGCDAPLSDHAGGQTCRTLTYFFKYFSTQIY